MAVKLQKFLIFALVLSLFFTGAVSAAEASSDNPVEMIIILAVAFVVGAVFLKVGLPIIIGLIIIAWLVTQFAH